MSLWISFLCLCLMTSVNGYLICKPGTCLEIGISNFSCKPCSSTFLVLESISTHNRQKIGYFTSIVNEKMMLRLLETVFDSIVYVIDICIYVINLSGYRLDYESLLTHIIYFVYVILYISVYPGYTIVYLYVKISKIIGGDHCWINSQFSVLSYDGMEIEKYMFSRTMYLYVFAFTSIYVWYHIKSLFTTVNNMKLEVSIAKNNNDICLAISI